MAKKYVLLACAATLLATGCARKVSPLKGKTTILAAKAFSACSQDVVDQYTSTSTTINTHGTMAPTLGTQCDSFVALKASSCVVDCKKLAGQTQKDFCPSKDKTFIAAQNLNDFCAKFKAAAPPVTPDSAKAPPLPPPAANPITTPTPPPVDPTSTPDTKEDPNQVIGT